MGKTKDHLTKTPIIVDLGKVPNKNLRKLKEGRGKLMDELRTTLDEVVKEMGKDLDGKEILPVVLVYGRKRKKKKAKLISFD